jgi:hypothetical protein
MTGWSVEWSDPWVVKAGSEQRDPSSRWLRAGRLGPTMHVDLSLWPQAHARRRVPKRTARSLRLTVNIPPRTG